MCKRITKLFFTCLISISLAATNFNTENNNELHKNALKVDHSVLKQQYASSKDVIRERKLDSGAFEGTNEEHVTTKSVQQEYTPHPKDNDKSASTFQRPCSQENKCDDDTTELKRGSTRTKIVKTSELKYPVQIIHLKRNKKSRNKRPQLEDPVTLVDRFSSGCKFAEISVGGMCVHSDGYF